MTHTELVQRAEQWLRKTICCGVVLVEHQAGFERPDAIGWKSAMSYLVECKVSWKDFAEDKKKPSRASYRVRPASQCYYMMPADLVAHYGPGEVAGVLPHGWGLLVAGPRLVRVAQAPPMFNGEDDRTPDQLRTELQRMCCELRRYQINGITYPKIPEGNRTPPRRGVRVDLAWPEDQQ